MEKTTDHKLNRRTHIIRRPESRSEKTEERREPRSNQKAEINSPLDKVDQASWESFPASDSPGWGL